MTASVMALYTFPILSGLALQRYNELFENVVAGGYSRFETLNGRTQMWMDALSDLSASGAYLFGVGPAKSSGGRIVDNEYVHMLVTYGIWGLITYIWFWKRHFTALRSNLSSALQLGLLAYLFVLLAYGLTANAFRSLEAMTLFSILLGISIGYGTKLHQNGYQINRKT